MTPDDALKFRKRGKVEDRLIEECAELIHIVCKARRFGLDKFNPFELGRGTNRIRIREEMDDVERLIREYREKIGQ